jgi:hypothetical protein
MSFCCKLTSFLILVFLLAPSGSYAHSVELFVEDNGDGTIYIEAGVSTGGPAAGAKVIIRDKETTQPLLTFSMPDSGKINVPMPKVPYTVTLDMGAGHIVTRTGPSKAGEKQDAAMQNQLKSSQPGTSMANWLMPLIAAAILICVTIALLTVSTRIRKKNDEFLKRKGRP